MLAERVNPSRQNALVCREGCAFLVRRPIPIRRIAVGLEQLVILTRVTLGFQTGRRWETRSHDGWTW